MSETVSATRDRWYRRAAATGHWLRDTGLGMFGVSLLGLVAASGWGGSTLGLRDFAATHMGYVALAAWLVPATFDGASVGLSIVAFRAAIHGRSATLTRVGIAAFTALSSWMNYERITDPIGRHIGMLLPIAGVTLLEALLAEARKAYERRHGQRQRTKLHPLRWVFDFSGTWAIVRADVLEVPLPEMATQHVTATPVVPELATATEVVPGAATSVPEQRNAATVDATGDATVTPISRARSGATLGGPTKSAMRAVWNRHVEAGTWESLTGKALADEAGMGSEALGRRYKKDWTRELVAAGVASAEAVAK